MKTPNRIFNATFRIDHVYTSMFMIYCCENLLFSLNKGKYYYSQTFTVSHWQVKSYNEEKVIQHKAICAMIVIYSNGNFRV